MSIPLVMLGPGGDFTTTLNVRGRGLTRQTGPVRGTQSGQGHDPQGDSAGGYAQWGRWRRPKSQATAQAEPQSVLPEQPAPTGDRFDHVPNYAPTDVYTDRGTLKADPGRSAVIHSALQWLGIQQVAVRGLGGLVSALRQTQPTSAESAPATPDPSAIQTDSQSIQTGIRVRIAGPPAAPPYPPAPLPATRPGHAEINHEHEPDTQAATHPHPHPRHPSVTRLFADDAGARRRAEGLQGHRVRARRGLDQKRRAHPQGEQGALFGNQS